ncbi:N-acetylglucosamine-6-phosphate deacetylase [Alkalicoccus chagannorensis]|uniref:N-acetylglucosamine-6-phosphate deacetylase n=1 Tax=Alkalicoccus chagannorensis TaxID=427072 RepID=UPI0003F792C5|nr:N-acetylglucosamine-6-phosphate deacetylase [Alkalicoccus chagannorensis]
MEREWYIRGGTVYHADGEKEVQPLIHIKGDRIVSVQEAAGPPEQADVLQLEDDDVILPGFIDIHIHGAYGHDVMDGEAASLEAMSRKLLQEGVTSFLGTTITSEEEATVQALRTLGAFETGEGASLLGIHLEGPFINPVQAGAQPLEAIHEPDVGLFQKWQEAADGQIRVVTFAPEQPGGLELLDYLAATGVTASIGHSDAGYDVIQEGEKRGLKHATHLFNGMRGLHHREPGVVGSVYLSSTLKAELILDHIHVGPEAAALSWKVLGADRLMLITDAMRGKGLGDGTFDLGGQPVYIHGKEARLEDGTLAGSVLTMDEAVRHALTFPGISWHDIVKMTSANQVASLGLMDQLGAVKKGYRADIAVMKPDGSVKAVICRGGRSV